MSGRRLALIEGQRAALAYSADPALMGRLRMLEGENRDLRRQLAELGAAPRALSEVNQTRKAESARLRAAIAAVLLRHTGSREPSRKAILRALEGMDLGGHPLPSLSAIGWHLRQIRAEGVNAAR